MSRKQKLPVFIISGKSPISASGGGYSTYAYNVARILKKLGHPLYIVSLGERTEEIGSEVGKILTFNLKIPFLNIAIYALPGLPIYSFLFARGIDKKSKEENYKKYIVWGIGPWGFAGVILKKLFQRRIILIDNYFTTTRHEWWGGVRALKVKDYGLMLRLKYLAIYLTMVQFLAVLEKILLTFTDVVITNYKSTENILKREFGIKDSKFTRLSFYVQIYKRKTKEKEIDLKLPSKYLFFISRHDPRKGVNFLLHTYKILLKMGYKIPLLIGGKGDMFEPNRKLADKLGIANHVRFLGFVNDPKPIMKNAEVFCFPSIEEGAGALTVNEAMEMGVPIVTTACDGIVEDIDNGHDGLLCTKEDPESMANCISTFLRNPDLARKLAKNARLKYSKQFSFDNMYKDIEKLMRGFS